MSDTAPSRRAVKARILGVSLADALVDIIAPTIIALALTSAGVATYLALTAGGVAVGAKTALGRFEQWRPDRHAAAVGVTTVLAFVALFGLAGAGAPDAVAAAAAGAITAVPVLAGLAGRGRAVDGIGLLVLAEVVTSIAVTLISGDDRFALARPALYTAVAGIGALASCRWGRPMMLDASKPMAAAGDPKRAEAFEAAWKRSRSFQRIERAMTAAFGVMLLAEAGLRVTIVYSAAHPSVATGAITANGPAVGLLAVFLVGVRLLAVPRARRIVDGYVAEAARPEAAAPVRPAAACGSGA